MIQELLRKPLAKEVVALLEKIDSIETSADSSYYRAKALIEAGQFNRYERMLLRNAVSRIPRRETLHEAMNVVINAPSDDPPTTAYTAKTYGSQIGLTVNATNKTLFQKLNNLIDETRARDEEKRRYEHEMRNLERVRLEHEIREKALELDIRKAKAEKEFGLHRVKQDYEYQVKANKKIIKE